MDAYERLAPFIREYVYQSGWTQLRDVQVAACEVIFGSDDHLLLSSGTASGKTEAAFLPALTLLYEKPSASAGILYIGPLKALINDQFERLLPLLEGAGLPVCKWHGDAGVTGKRHMMAEPKGVVQITPESLESLLMNRPAVCARMFSDLRFVIVDEVHAFMDSPRGTQLMCLLERLERLTGVSPRRVGLSATLSDRAAAAKWLASGTLRACQAPVSETARKRMWLRMERYDVLEGYEEVYESVYRVTLGQKAIVFVNSRSEAEESAAALKAIAAREGTRDAYRVHHGSLSAAIRQDAEREMKLSEESVVTCATLTLELGVDIGRLDEVVQLGSPHSVSSLVQRLGRCGRRGQHAKLLFVIEEKRMPEVREMPWELVKGVAILELFLRERWTEPVRAPKRPYSILFQQMLSVLRQEGERTAPQLAKALLTMAPFREITKEDFVCLARSALEQGFLEKSERGSLLLGEAGETLTSNYDFYAAFEAREEMEARCGNEVIGTVTGMFQPGDIIRLAGRTWEIIDMNARTVFLKETRGNATSAWESLAGTSLHERVLQKMREVLESNDTYAYMSDSCAERLREAREIAREEGFLRRRIVRAGGALRLYPWFGSERLEALALLLPSYGVEATVGPTRATPVYLECDIGDERELAYRLRALAKGHDAPRFSDHFAFPGKYAEYLPRELLEKEYCCDRIDLEGLREALLTR